jgi:hypothetical protein
MRVITLGNSIYYCLIKFGLNLNLTKSRHKRYHGIMEQTNNLSQTRYMELTRQLNTVKELYRKGRKAGKSVLHAVEDSMNLVESCSTHGLECITAKYTNTTVYYLNTGDSYGHTLMCYVADSRARFVLGNWGDLAETGKYE